MCNIEGARETFLIQAGNSHAISRHIWLSKNYTLLMAKVTLNKSNRQAIYVGENIAK